MKEACLTLVCCMAARCSLVLVKLLCLSFAPFHLVSRKSALWARSFLPRAFLKVAPLPEAPCNRAPDKLAPLRFAFVRLVFRRSAFLRFAPFRFAPFRFAPLNFAPWRFLPLSFACCSFALAQLAFGPGLQVAVGASGAEEAGMLMTVRAPTARAAVAKSDKIRFTPPL